MIGKIQRFIPVLYILILLLLAGCKAVDPILIFAGCKEESKEHNVELEQIDDFDGSHNDKYQFKDAIDKDNWRKKRYKKGAFE